MTVRQSSLLSAIIGEMTRAEGNVEVYGSIAYAPQNPWIMSTSVRDNITFYRHFDEEFYNVVLDGASELTSGPAVVSEL